MHRHIAILAGILILVSSCTLTPKKSEFPGISYAHLPKISLNVARVEVANNFQPSLDAPNVAHLMPLSLAESVQNWAHERLRPVGHSGTVRVVLDDASVVETKLETDKNILAWYTVEQAERYDAVVKLSVSILNDAGQELVSVKTTVTRSSTAEEYITIQQRHRVWFALVEAVLKDLNLSLENLVYENMKDWVQSPAGS